MLKTFSLNPPDQRVYITHPKEMNIANLVNIFCTNEYNHYLVLSLSILMLYSFTRYNLQGSMAGKRQPSPWEGIIITIKRWLKPASINNVGNSERKLTIKDR